jgi:putative aldouronate transport system permease protein
LFATILRQKEYFLLVTPFVVIVFIFDYVPVWGWLMAFQEYVPYRGIAGSPWVGLEQFRLLFTDNEFYRVIRNTLAMSVLKLLFTFPSAILLAIGINELRSVKFKRSVQTITYLPHFVSWVVAANIVLTVLATESGLLNQLLSALGAIERPIPWMGRPQYFWMIIALSHVWKEVGWSSIIYLSAMSAIDPELYQSASIDGASRLQKIRYITVPGIVPVFRVLLVMQLGWLLRAGFEQQLLLQNSLVLNVSEVIDIYVLRFGLNLSRYSLATAAGMFKTVVSVILILTANEVSKRVSGERLL